MKTLLLSFLISCLAYSAGPHSKGSDFQRPYLPESGFGSPFITNDGPPLTAKEVESGPWVPDEEGGCDLEKGCAYANKETGEVRYLPDEEKKKLKKKKEESVKEETSGKLTELKDKSSWDEKFETEKDKKKLVLIFSAEDCGPCKALKAKLEKEAPQGVGLFTAIRPTYRSVQGHKLHESFKSSIGGSVPVAFIYTQDDNGKWNGQIVKGNKIYPAIQAGK